MTQSPEKNKTINILKKIPKNLILNFLFEKKRKKKIISSILFEKLLKITSLVSIKKVTTKVK